MNHYAETAVEAATRAGEYLLQNYKRHHIDVDGVDTTSVANRGLSKEITSSVDYRADEIITGLIQKRHPSHNILTEETGFVDNGSAFTWLIDPLDGSANYVNHNPFFAVSICLMHRVTPITGVIFAPYLEELVVARRGHGCTINGRAAKVSTTTTIDNAYIVGCPGGDPDNKRFAKMGYVLHADVKSFRMIGSASIESYMVATGRADAFTTLSISSWDVAAGILCVQEAGGVVTDFNGAPWSIGKSDLLISNRHLHDAILSKIRGTGIHEESTVGLDVRQLSGFA